MTTNGRALLPGREPRESVHIPKQSGRAVRLRRGELLLQQGDWLESALSVSEVVFKKLSEEEIRAYVASGECDDKAGAYAIQGRAARFVAELRGSYSGVMGLPLYETGELLDKVPARR